MKTRTLFVLAAIVFVICACLPQRADSPLESVTESPLPPPFQDPALLDNRWELVSLAVDGTAVDYSSVQPLYIRFYTKSLQYSSPKCAGGGVLVTSMPNKTFIVDRGPMTGMDCGQERNKQRTLLNQSFLRVTSYELIENEVLLTGENVVATLVLDTPWAKP